MMSIDSRFRAANEAVQRVYVFLERTNGDLAKLGCVGNVS